MNKTLGSPLIENFSHLFFVHSFLVIIFLKRVSHLCTTLQCCMYIKLLKLLKFFFKNDQIRVAQKYYITFLYFLLIFKYIFIIKFNLQYSHKSEKVMFLKYFALMTYNMCTPVSRQLVHVLWDVCGHFSRDTVVQAALNRLLTALGEAAKYQAILVDQAARAIARNMTAFIRT